MVRGLIIRWLCQTSCKKFDPQPVPKQSVAPLDGPNRQLPIASGQRMRPTLAGHSAVPRGTNTTPMNANRAIRIAAQRTQGYEDQILCFGWRYELQRTLAIRIAAITLASDSAVTIARFRPSKISLERMKNQNIPPFKTRRGGERRRGEGSETFFERKWVLRRFPEVS